MRGKKAAEPNKEPGNRNRENRTVQKCTGPAMNRKKTCGRQFHIGVWGLGFELVINNVNKEPSEPSNRTVYELPQLHQRLGSLHMVQNGTVATLEEALQFALRGTPVSKKTPKKSECFLSCSQLHDRMGKTP